MVFFYLLCIGVVVGWFAGQFITKKGFGTTGDVIAGVAGALTSGYLIEKTGYLAGSGLIVILFASATGSVLFLYGLRGIKKT